jgi:Flp pilus assembly protein TadD
MTLSPDISEAIQSGPLARAEQVLRLLLPKISGDFVSLGYLGAGLVRCGRYGLASLVFVHWTEQTPDNPEPWSNLGLCLTRQRQFADARTVLEHALALKPDFYPAINNLCEVYRELGDHSAQLLNALEGVRRQPSSPQAFNNMATALLENGQIEEAAHAFETSLMLNPKSFEAGFNLAKISFDQGELDKAMQHVDKLYADHAHTDSRQKALIEYLLSFRYLESGRLKEGWAFYEHGFSPLIPRSFTRGPDRQFNVPRWDGAALRADQTLMIWREQGIGDELRFAAALPELVHVGGRIIIECDPRLVDALQRSLPTFYVRAVPTKAETTSTDTADYDFQLPMGSLAGLYMQSAENFGRLGGYLQPSVFQSAKYAQRLSEFDGLKKIGICWRSHQLSATRNKKYTVLEDWQDILSTPNAVFVNLQYGDCEQELLEAERRHGIKILRWPDTDLKNDLEAVMGLMQNLDLVISPSTAVVPIAGAVGRKTIFIGHSSWVILGEKTRYPWFSSVHPVLVDKTLPVASGLPEAKRLMDVFLSGAV